MPVEIKVPEMGESVLEATVSRWLKRVGEPVKVGDPLVELETDKVNTELPADDAGVIRQILAEEGQTVHPGDVLAVIDPEGTPSGPEVAPAPASEPHAPVEAPAAEPAPAPPAAPPAEEEEVRASPMAERLAEELGVDLAEVPASGAGGRVTKADVEAYARESEPGRDGEEAARRAGIRPPVGAEAPRMPPGEPPAADRTAAAVAAPPAAPAPTAKPREAAPPAAAPTPAAPGARPETRRRLSRRRLTIARRLVEAQQEAAMLTTFNELDMSAVMALRKKRRDAFQERYGVSLGFMSFFTKASVGALKAFPQINAELEGEELVLKHHYDIGIAIGDQEGLVVPVLRDADRMTFAEIEQAIAAFVQKAKERTLSIDDLRGGTFTITNGGVYGSLLSTPILNPPQVGILGMHKIQERAVVVNGDIVVRPMMYVALTYDHRVVDGREAVQFLIRVKELIEDPERLLLEG